MQELGNWPIQGRHALVEVGLRMRPTAESSFGTLVLLSTEFSVSAPDSMPTCCS